MIWDGRVCACVCVGCCSVIQRVKGAIGGGKNVVFFIRDVYCPGKLFLIYPLMSFNYFIRLIILFIYIR